jgi:hypothetical protein
MTYGFIILRHVVKATQNFYWIECVRCIRNFYPDIKILIIDDNSDSSIISNINYDNIDVIHSEFKKRGELLPYIYYLENKIFDKAIILHDSVFIQKYINFDKYNNEYLWYFEHHSDSDDDEKFLLSKLENNKNLINFYDKKDLWSGCFGAMTVISYDFLYIINLKYNLYNLIPHIKTRHNRCCFERVLAVILTYELNNIYKIKNNNNSIFGAIESHYCSFHYSFLKYLEDRDNNLIKRNCNIIKTWTGR